MGLIQWVSRTTETNYVNIDLDSGNSTGECEATEGDANIGPQPMTVLAPARFATILHEMGHEIGLYHEQSRSDRDTYITVNYQNLIKGSRFNFDIIQDNVQNLALYDYASVMEYPAFSFTRNGGPAIDSIPAGMPLSNGAGYSAADIEGVERLYGAPPTSVTITSNPPGLQVIVDGSTITTPQVFSWALNSTHTLNVQTNVQTLNGDIVGSTMPTTFYYMYGRWNDNTAASHTITVTPGNGELPFPSTSPQVSTYSANFVQVVPYTAAIFPTGDGSVGRLTNAAKLSRSFRRLFRGAPAGNSHRYAHRPISILRIQQCKFLAPRRLGSKSENLLRPRHRPRRQHHSRIRARRNCLHRRRHARSFQLESLYLRGRWLLLRPKNFAPFYDSTWTSGSTHTINVDTLEYPYSSNTRYAFSSWSDSGAHSHSIILPGGGATTPRRLFRNFSPATISISLHAEATPRLLRRRPPMTASIPADRC